MTGKVRHSLDTATRSRFPDEMGDIPRGFGWTSPLSAPPGPHTVSDVKKNRIATRLWERAVDLLLDSVIGTVLFTLTATLIITGVATLPAMGVGLILLWLAGLLSRVANSAERGRAAALYGVRILPPTRRRTAQTGPLRWAAQPLIDLVDPVTWRTLLSHLISMVLGLVMIGIFSAGCQLVILSGRSSAPYLAYVVGIVCLAGLLAYIYFAGVLDEQQSVALLGPSTTAALERQVGTLDAARRGAVDAASLERERIERNLHDGIQPQMVSVAMTLGMARAKMDADPQAAKLLHGR